MNKIEINKLIIEDYTDMPYFNEIVSYVEKHQKEVLDFFKMFELKNTWTLKFLPYEDFKKHMLEKNGICREFVRGDTSKNEKTIRALNVEDAIKYTTHKDTDLMQICKMIIHEYAHACYSEVLPDSALWFNEGIAQYLANQPLIIKDVSNEDFTVMLNNFYEYHNKCYTFSHYVVKYLFENYPLDEIHKLTFDKEYLVERTKDLFEETKKWTKEQSEKEKNKPIL